MWFNIHLCSNVEYCPSGQPPPPPPSRVAGTPSSSLPGCRTLAKIQIQYQQRCLNEAHTYIIELGLIFISLKSRSFDNFRGKMKSEHAGRWHLKVLPNLVGKGGKYEKLACDKNSAYRKVKVNSETWRIANLCFMDLALPGINLTNKLWLSLQSVTFWMDINWSIWTAMWILDKDIEHEVVNG